MAGADVALLAMAVTGVVAVIFRRTVEHPYEPLSNAIGTASPDLAFRRFRVQGHGVDGREAVLSEARADFGDGKTERLPTKDATPVGPRLPVGLGRHDQVVSFRADDPVVIRIALLGLFGLVLVAVFGRVSKGAARGTPVEGFRRRCLSATVLVTLAWFSISLPSLTPKASTL